MCPISRRQLLAGAAGLSLAGASMPLAAGGVAINPRSSWGSDLPPKGPLESEDVRFLIVHHSASRSDHTAADVPSILRSWYHFHTGPEKGWNDVAYNFVIDAEGGVWEARTGSLDGPVAGDATGGNQGFSQLVAIIGDYNQTQPTQASLSSLVQVLAWLADRHGLSTAPGAEASFVSRGSNKWPSGTSVTTPTITGHRTMSKTTCPGDNLFSYVAGGLIADVHAIRGGAAPTQVTTTTTEAPVTTAAGPTTTSTPQTASTTVPPVTSSPSTTSSTTSSTSASVETATSTTGSATTTVPTPSTEPPTNPPTTVTPVAQAPTTTIAAAPGSESSVPGSLAVGAGVVVALVSGLLVWRRNRMR